MSRIRITNFAGVIPKVEPRNLPDNAAQVASNCWLSEANLQPIKAPSVIQSIPAGQVRLFPWRRGGAKQLLTWDHDVHVVESPIADDQWDRIYYTDGTTLHEKLWVSGAAVDVADVSFQPPAVPTITKTQLFTDAVISGISLTIQGQSLDQIGHEWDANVPTLLKLYFDFPTYRTDSLSPDVYAQGYRLTVDTGDGAKSVPTFLGDPAPKVFTDVLSLKNGSPLAEYATFQVVSVEGYDILAGFSPPGAGTWHVPCKLAVSVNITFKRTETTYPFYVQTLVNLYGQESPPSPISDQVTWKPNDVLHVLTHAGTGGVSARIYRTGTGTNSQGWFFVAEVGPGTTYIDDNADKTLTEVLPLIENPPTAMKGLVRLPNGVCAAFDGKQVFLSEPWLPYSWPTKYRLTTRYNIVGMAVTGSDLTVLTEGLNEIVSGTEPSITTESVIPLEQSCVSERSICVGEGMVLYASPDGLVGGVGGNFSVLTAGHYTADQWLALTPSSMVGSVHDGRFIGFAPGGNIVWDLREEATKKLTTTTETAAGVCSDIIDDSLYMIQGSSIKKWRGSATPETAVWRTKVFQTIATPIWNSAQVIATSYNATTFRIYADGTLKWSYAVTSNRAFRLPKLGRYENWCVEIETVDTVVELLFAPSMQELRPGKIHAGPPVQD